MNLPLPFGSRNVALLLRTLRTGGPLSRARIADVNGLKPATVTRLAAEALALGLVEEVGTQPARSGEGGHPQVLLDIRPEGAHVVGCHLGVRLVTAALADNRGTILARKVARRPYLDSPHTTIELIRDLAFDVADQVSLKPQELDGVGIATVAIVNPTLGYVIHGPEIGWEDVALAQLAAGLIGRPVAVDSNYRSFMRAEALLGVAQHARNALLIHVGTTIGAALLINHRIHEGDSFGAGRLGHAVVDPDGPPCTCGGRGCLNVMAAEPAFPGLAANSKHIGRSILAERIDNAALMPADVYEAAAKSDVVALEILASAARLLAKKLIDISLLLDIQLIVISGPILAADEAFLSPLREAVEARVRNTTGTKPVIVPSRFGTDAQAVGAVALALDRFASGRRSTAGLSNVQTASAAPSLSGL